jgi:hypothetical protein
MKRSGGESETRRIWNKTNRCGFRPMDMAMKERKKPVITAPTQTGAFTASATNSPKMMIDDQMQAPRMASASRTLLRKACQHRSTKAMGQTQIARPPASTAHRPTASMDEDVVRPVKRMSNSRSEGVGLSHAGMSKGRRDERSTQSNTNQN